MSSERRRQDLLALADRLFEDFDDLPIMTVIRALNASRTQIGDDVVDVNAIEALSRESLTRERSRPTRRPHYPWISSVGAWLGTIAVGVAAAVDRLGIDPVAT